MQDQSIIVAVIDFGSTSIKAALAEKYGQDKKFRIIASAEEPTEGCIRRGVIFNLNDTAEKVKHLLNHLEQKTGHPIRKIYAAVGGQSLHSHAYFVEMPFEAPHEIVQEDLNTLLKEVEQFSSEEYVLLSEVSPRYYVNGTETQKPVGVQALQLKAEYQLILARPDLTAGIDNVLGDKLGLEVPDLLMAPVVMARGVLTQEQMRIGCALVDFGGACTTVSVYRNGVLDKLRVIPIGSQSITSDLTRLYISPAEAERVKCIHGSVLLPDPKKQTKLEVLSSDMISYKQIPLYAVNQYIEARAKEIIDNVRAVLKGAHGKLDLPGGVVLTGGGSKLRDFRAKMANELGVEVELISNRVAADRTNEKYILDPAWHVIYSMVPFALESCEGILEEQIEEVPAGTSSERGGMTSDTTQTAHGVQMPNNAPTYFPEDEVENTAPVEQPLIPQEEQDELVVTPPSPGVKSKARAGKNKKNKKGGFKNLLGMFSSMLPSDDTYSADVD